MNIFNSESKKEADQIYSNIQYSEGIVNQRIATAQEIFQKKTQLLGYEKVKFQSKEIKKLIEQLNRIRGNVQYKTVDYIDLSLNDIMQLEHYSLYAEKLMLEDTSIKKEMSTLAAGSMLNAAGIYGVTFKGTSGFIASTTKSFLGNTAVIKGNLSVIGGGGFLKGALGLNKDTVSRGTIFMGMALIVPVAVAGVYLKRNKNRRCLERALEDLQKSNKEIALQNAKCSIVEKVSNSLDIYKDMFSKFRQSATKLYDQIYSIESDYNNAKISGNISEIDREEERILNSIIMSIVFLKNSKSLIETDVLKKASEDIPKINDLFDTEIRGFDNSLN